MFSHSTEIRIHYALTDQMGFVYHGNYAQFFEIARVEALRSIGITYKDIEKMGVLMPVIDLHIRFMRPVKYDDLIRVTVKLTSNPADAKVIFTGEIHNPDGELCSTSTVVLLYVDAKTNKRTATPTALVEALAAFYN